jgi:zinc transport system ATP-binding protein
MGDAVVVRDLGVTFGGTPILDGLSFAVPAGTTLAVIGPNGSGKTVLFRALIGAVPARGSIQWAADTRIGYVPQKLDIERDLPITGLDFLAAKAAVVRAPTTEIARLLALVDLPQAVAGQTIGTLSGGQFQRLLLAFAFMGRPTVLLFDEPTAGVDEPGEEGIYALLRRLQHEHGLTLLLISHELSLVYRYADMVLCLSRRRGFLGPPVEILTPERLQEAYGTPMKFHLHDGPGA